jgi:UDP-glucose 4-epimerase
MKILVTGGAGFIGSHLSEALVSLGHNVVALDDLSLGSKENLKWASGKSGFQWINGDIRDPGTVSVALKGCDWVFHLAAMPSVPRSIQIPWETNATNLDATLQLLLAARDAGVSRFVFASSSAIYGDTEVPVKREDLPPNPLSPYALQKYAGERYCQLFSSLYGMPTVALRYFNVFGPRQSFSSPYSGVIARFCSAFLEGEAPVIFGDGSQSRDFTFIRNVIDANLSAASAPAASVAGKVFNVACGDSISLLDLVTELGRLTGRALKPVFHPARPGDVKHSRADITEARSAFGFSPSVDWRLGLERTLEWYRARR